MLLPCIDVNHFSKASFNFSYVPVFSLCCFSDEFWNASKIFSLFFFQVARVLPGILNWFATSSLGLPFSSSFNVLYFQSRSHFMMLPFCVHFCHVSHQQSNWNKFKGFKTFEYYSELTTVEYRRMEKLDSKTKIRITWWKICSGDPKICSI